MRTLKDMVAKYVDPQGLNWESDIKACIMAYNSSVHTTTGYSLLFMLHGSNPKTPLEPVMSPPDNAVPIRVWIRDNQVSVGGKPKLGLYFKGPGAIIPRLGGGEE